MSETVVLSKESEDTLFDLSDIISCRLCGESSFQVKYIFLRNNEDLLRNIYGVTQIEINFDGPIDKLFPKQICEGCFDQINAFTQFKLQCQYWHSQWMLQINENRYKDDVNGAGAGTHISVLENNIIELTNIIVKDDGHDKQEFIFEPPDTIESNEDPETYTERTVEYFDEIEWIEYEEEDLNQEDSQISKSLSASTHDEDGKNINQQKNPLVNCKHYPDTGKEQDTKSLTRINRYGYSYKTTAFNYFTKTDDGEFECKLCGSQFKWSYQCEFHVVRCHTKETPFVCRHCDKKFMVKHNLNRHIKNVHRPSEFTCKFCGRRFTRKYLLNEHEMEHSGSPTFNCPKCTLKFYGNSKLTAHLRNYHSDRKYVCDVCRKTFKTKTRLAEHRVRHSSNKDFICSHCDKGFVTKRDLTVHKKRLQTTKP